MTTSLLELDEVGVHHRRDGEDLALLSGVSFTLGAGESLAIVGESGSGKTLTTRAILGLLPAGLHATGRITVSGQRVDGDSRAATSLRGGTASLLMQDPFTLLNPLRRIGAQLADAFPAPLRRDRRSRVAEIARRLAEVGLPPAVAARYPFQLSGGMRQRVGIAAALVRDPSVLIADEPTTALDVTTQREVLRLIRRIQTDRGMGFVLVTHDLRIAFSMCDRVLVLNAGQVVETGDARTVRRNPQHPYTAALLAAEPSLEKPVDRSPRTKSSPVLMRTSLLTKQYTGTETLALADLTLTVHEGESVGVVGESGSGKTTLSRCIVGLETPTSGSITLGDVTFEGWSSLPARDRRDLRGSVQMVFQDPYSSLNPMRTIGGVLAEALDALGRPSTRRDVAGLLERVGLASNYAERRPAALSGGQRQRVAIARALAAEPRLLICDEAVSALDVSVQAQILDLLKALQREQGTALLFVTHDLAVVQQVTETLYVMKQGRCVENGPTDQVLTDPADDYTRQLLAAVPQDDPQWLQSDRHASPSGDAVSRR